MAKKLNSVLGIDIGSQCIKVAELRVQGRDAVVTALGMIDTPEGAVDHTGVYNSDAVGQALKQVLAQSGASTNAAVVSITGQASVLVRTLEVPKMNPGELNDHMQWEISRNVPFSESTIVSDFKALGGDDPNSPNMDVVMAISPQSAIDTMISCVKKAGKSVAAIDVEPLSLARSIEKSYDDTLSTKTVCVVDLGHSTCSINIYHGAKLLMPRQVPLGGELFTKAIADAFQMSLTDAEQMKRTQLDIPETAGASTTVADPFGIGSSPAAASGTTSEFQPYNPFGDEPGFVPPDAAGTAPAAAEPPPSAEPPADSTPVVPAGAPESRQFQAVLPMLEELVAEIRRSIDYYRSRGGDVDQLEICGGGSKIKGLASYLHRAMGIPCDSYDPTRRLNINAKKVAPGFIDEHREEFAVAIGNGLHIFFD